MEITKEMASMYAYQKQNSKYVVIEKMNKRQIYVHNKETVNSWRICKT